MGGRPLGGGIRPLQAVPFATIHLLCLGVLVVGWSPIAVVVALLAAAVRMFVITAFYHRYFSHRAFRTHRVIQFLAAIVGTTTAQRGPIWWAAHHRHHHRTSDQETDLHSASRHGFWWSHLGWFLSRDGMRTRWSAVPDLVRQRELVWVERLHLLGPIGLAVAMFALGALLEQRAPGLGTSGWQMLVWGFAISTTALYHATFTINSLAHRFGSRRYATRDDSRNNFWLALLTFGEGWHNNHHHYPAAARQGFHWWEIDPTYAALWLGSKVGLVWDLRPVPARVRAGGGGEVAR